MRQCATRPEFLQLSDLEILHIKLNDALKMYGFLLKILIENRKTILKTTALPFLSGKTNRFASKWRKIWHPIFFHLFLIPFSSFSHLFYL